MFSQAVHFDSVVLGAYIHLSIWNLILIMLTAKSCFEKKSLPPYSTAMPGLLVREAMLLHTLGVMQRGSSFHDRVVSLKNHVSSVGQGPPPRPPLGSERVTLKMNSIAEMQIIDRELLMRQAQACPLKSYKMSIV